MNRALVTIAVWCLIWHPAALQPTARAEGGLGDAIDCTDVTIDYTDDPSLTREERLRLMDKAFMASLNRFELCQAAQKRASAAGGASTNGGEGGGAANGNGGGAGAAADSGLAGDGDAASVASPTMTGTEPAQNTETAEGLKNVKDGAGQDVVEADRTADGQMTSANGKLPEDIPPAANDDALAAQIRYAAENEPDPVKAKQLWNEYRKYKGMVPEN